MMPASRSTPEEVRIRISDHRARTPSDIVFPAGSEGLCLDYANTRFWRGTESPAERLNSFGDLLDWLAGSAGTPTDAIAAVKSAALRDGPHRMERLFGEAIELREAIYRICSALAAGRTGAEVDLAALNRVLAAAPARERLAPIDDTYGWAAAGFDFSAPTLLAPVLWSAADLLTRADRSRLRRCANDRCLWLFIDRSKTGTRRWCDMSSCGNRAKAHRHYLKSKAG